MNRVHRADRRVLEEIYRDHAAFVWRAVLRLGVDEATAEDLVHEVFLVVQRRLADYDGRASMTSWLYGIARGVTANHRRGRGRAARRLQLVVPPDAEPAPGPDQHVAVGEAADMVAGFLESLDPGKREVFELAELEGMRGPEIAAALGVKVDTVYSRLREARLRFQRLADRHRRAEARRMQRRAR